MSRVIAIISGKGGVGKTTITANLASLLASKGKDVVAIDANFTTPNLSIHLGMPFVSPTIHDVLKGNARLWEALHYHPSGLKVVAGGLANEDNHGLDPRSLSYFVSSMKGSADYIFIDAAAGLGREAMSAIEAADDIIVVVNPELPSVLDALKTIKLARRMGKHVLGAVVNRRAHEGHELSNEDIADFLDVPILEEIPEDSAVRHAIREKNPVVHHKSHSRASRRLYRLASLIAGEDFEPELKWYHRAFPFLF